MNASTKAALAAIFASVAGAASAQSSVTLYGDIDQYINYMHAGNGQKIISIEDGALLRSRWGLKGSEDLGNGYAAKFQVEGGFSADNGQNASTPVNNTTASSSTGATTASSSVFDRQAWLGLATPWGELRMGRQNSAIQTRGGYVDYTARDMGSVVNYFPVPSRYDNDVSFISKRYGGLQLELHAALPETTNSNLVGQTGSGNSNRAIIYQWAADYLTPDFALGYMGLVARPSGELKSTSTTTAPNNVYYNQNVQYHQAYADWYYGHGTVYLTFVHSNDVNNGVSSTSSSLGNSGGNGSATNQGNGTAGNQYNAGTTPTHFFNVVQVSADYVLLPNLRIGGLWGKIKDTSHNEGGATGASVGAYWDLSKRTTVYSTVDTLRNESNAGWKLNGSGSLKSQFSTADVQNKRVNGAQVGFLVRF